MRTLRVVFSHGKDSGPAGSKIRAMSVRVRDLGHRSASIDYRGMDDPGARVEKLVRYCHDAEEPLVLVGSSMGGHVAATAAERVSAAGLFVLAPAFYIAGYEELTPPPPDLPVTIVHGWQDDVVPVDNSIRYARQCAAALHVLDDGHRLTASIDTINLLLEHFLERIAAA